MAALNWSIEFKLLRAFYTPSVDRPALGLKKDEEVRCRVFGCYQVKESDDDIYPCFVIELESGRCTHALPEQIRFIREEDECF